MRGFICRGGNVRRAGYQKHHLIPVEIFCSRRFEALFAQVRTLGCDPRDFSANGIWLPGTEAEAERTGLPLHRGPHPHYSMLVRESIDTLCFSPSFRRAALPSAIERAKRIHYLQGNLRRTLSLSQPGLNRVGHDMDDACLALADDYSRLAKAPVLA